MPWAAQVYADRMIALQPVQQMVPACGVGAYNATDGTHNNPACNCSDMGGTTAHPTPDWGKWTVHLESSRFVGRQPVYLPYFFYQQPLPAYPGTAPFGFWYSTPKAGQCSEEQRLGDQGCTWKRHPRARTLWGSDLLRLGWNATFTRHWPLHNVSSMNTTGQGLHNLPLLRDAFASLSHAVAEPDPACASII